MDGWTDGPTDGPTDGRTDTTSYRDATAHLKIRFFFSKRPEFNQRLTSQCIAENHLLFLYIMETGEDTFNRLGVQPGGPATRPSQGARPGGPARGPARGPGLGTQPGGQARGLCQGPA